MDFFTCFTREKTPQNNFSSQNFSVENNYFLPTLCSFLIYTTYRRHHIICRGGVHFRVDHCKVRRKLTMVQSAKKIKNGQYNNALIYTNCVLFLPNQIVCESLCNWFLFYIISEHCSSLTTTYVHIYKCLLRSYSHAPPWHFYACGVDKKHTLATRGARSVAMWLYRRSMSLKSWKNLEDRLVYIVVLLLLLGHGVVADVAAIATMDENHGLSSKQQ